jgi:hypothetical protein
MIAVHALVLAALSPDVRHYAVAGPDGLKGQATLINRIQADGSKYVRLSMNLRYGNGETAEVLQESSYDQTGKPTRKLQAVKSSGARRSIVVTFTDGGAKVVEDQGAGPKVSLVSPPDGADTRAVTEFWFVRDKPKVGQTATYYAFRPNQKDWVEIKARYDGMKEIVVAGKRVKAHNIVMGEVRSWVDDQGGPLRIEVAGVTLERAPE